jgi:hypothetical protein
MPHATTSADAGPGHAADRWGVRRELRDLLVAVTGGAIVGMPLLYTMEMWLHRLLLGPGQQLALLSGILQVRIEYRTPRDERRSLDVLVDYLGQSSEQVIYAYFRDDPRALSIHAEAISYRVD